MLPTTPTYIVISQEFPQNLPNHNNQRGLTCDNSTNNEVIYKWIKRSKVMTLFVIENRDKESSSNISSKNDIFVNR